MGEEGVGARYAPTKSGKASGPAVPDASARDAVRPPDPHPMRDDYSAGLALPTVCADVFTAVEGVPAFTSLR
jgi:hypothetical protein